MATRNEFEGIWVQYQGKTITSQDTGENGIANLRAQVAKGAAWAPKRLDAMLSLAQAVLDGTFDPKDLTVGHNLAEPVPTAEPEQVLSAADRYLSEVRKRRGGTVVLPESGDIPE